MLIGSMTRGHHRVTRNSVARTLPWPRTTAERFFWAGETGLVGNLGEPCIGSCLMPAADSWGTKEVYQDRSPLEACRPLLLVRMGLSSWCSEST